MVTWSRFGLDFVEQREGSKMANIKVHAGDFNKWGTNSFSAMFGSVHLTLTDGKSKVYRAADIVEITVASEQNAKRIGGAVGWGAVGSLAFGPLGLLAGVMAGGNSKDVTFIARFKDGRKLLGTIDGKAFTKLQAIKF